MKKTYSGYFIFGLFLILFLLYFSSRLINLTNLPVFGDEAIYIRWSQVIRAEENLRFLPLTDGKPPLFMWLTAAILDLTSDPLWAGRFISVLAGWGIVVVLFFTLPILINYQQKSEEPLDFVIKSLQTFSPYGFMAGLLYISLPFSYFFDRLALADTLLSFFALSSFFFTLLLAKFPRLDLSLILGTTLGLAWLTKPPALYFVCLSLATYLFLQFQRFTPPRSFRHFIYPLISLLISYFIFNLLRLGPQFGQIALRNRDYIWPVTDIIRHPLDPLQPHLSAVFTIFQYYFSWPILILGLGLTTVYFLRSRQTFFGFKLLISTSCWWLLPLLATTAVARVITARYILFIIPYLILSFGLILFTLLPAIKLKFILPIFLAFSLPNIFYLYQISFQPFSLKLPATEAGYITDWTSGWGIKEAADILIKHSLSKGVVVGTEGNFGTLPDGLQIYTNKVPHLTVVGQGNNITELPSNLVNAKNHQDEAFILANLSRLHLSSTALDQLHLIARYPKPDGDFLVLYQL